MIADIAARYLKELGWKWRLKDETLIEPTPEDVEKALDELVRRVYTDGDGGNQGKMGHLLIERTPHGTFDVYIHLGEIR